MDEIEIDLSALTKNQQNEEISKWWFEIEQIKSDIWFNTGPL